MVNTNSSPEGAPRRLRERLKEATQDAILEAAEEAFARDGAAGARMESIAQATGVAVGTLYNHFQDRDALIDAVMRARQAALFEALDASLERTAGAPFEHALEDLVAAAQTHFAQHGAFLRMLMKSEHQPLGARVVDPAQVMGQLRCRLEVLVDRGLAAGAIRAGDAPFFPWFLLGTLRALLVRGMQGCATEPAEGERAALLRFALRGAGVPP